MYHHSLTLSFPVPSLLSTHMHFLFPNSFLPFHFLPFHRLLPVPCIPLFTVSTIHLFLSCQYPFLFHFTIILTCYLSLSHFCANLILSILHFFFSLFTCFVISLVSSFYYQSHSFCSSLFFSRHFLIPTLRQMSR